jgi:hypothetical protein
MLCELVIAEVNGGDEDVSILSDLRCGCKAGRFPNEHQPSMPRHACGRLLTHTQTGAIEDEFHR